jgi:hypothetical protein
MVYDKTCSLHKLPVAAYKKKVETAGSLSNNDASLHPALRSEQKKWTNEGLKQGVQKCVSN